MTSTARRRTLVLACGALAHELRAITAANQLSELSVECLPASLHNRPSEIPEAVRNRIRAARAEYDDILVGYADCGTGGRLDAVCEEEGVERLPGAHCYEFFAGRAVFAEMQDHELGSFYLTDFLVKHFDRLVWTALGLDEHPELLPMYFGNYTRVVYLAQSDDPELVAKAEKAAAQLGVRLDVRPTGYGELESTVVEFGRHHGPMGNVG